MKQLTLTATPRGFAETRLGVHKKLLPIATLTKEQWMLLKKQADVQDGREMAPFAVLQILSSTRTTESFSENMPRRLGFRLIDHQRKVYSFGEGMDCMEDLVWGLSLQKDPQVYKGVAFASSEEWRSFGTRYVTSLQLYEGAYYRVVRHLKSCPSNEGSFDKESFTVLVREVLENAGYSIDPLKAVVGSFVSSLSYLVPLPLRPLFSKLTSALQWVAQKVMVAVGRVLMSLVGDRRASALSRNVLFAYDAAKRSSIEELFSWQKRQWSTCELLYTQNAN
jgi:hypothetical protein